MEIRLLSNVKGPKTKMEEYQNDLYVRNSKDQVVNIQVGIHDTEGFDTEVESL